MVSGYILEFSFFFLSFLLDIVLLVWLTLEESLLSFLVFCCLIIEVSPSPLLTFGYKNMGWCDSKYLFSLYFSKSSISDSRMVIVSVQPSSFIPYRYTLVLYRIRKDCTIKKRKFVIKYHREIISYWTSRNLRLGNK